MTYDELDRMAEFLEQEAKELERRGLAKPAGDNVQVWLMEEAAAARRVAKRLRETVLAEAPPNVDAGIERLSEG